MQFASDLNLIKQCHTEYWKNNIRKAAYILANFCKSAWLFSWEKRFLKIFLFHTIQDIRGCCACHCLYFFLVKFHASIPINMYQLSSVWQYSATLDTIARYKSSICLWTLKWTVECRSSILVCVSYHVLYFLPWNLFTKS